MAVIFASPVCQPDSKMPTEFINRVEASCGSSGDKIKRCRDRLRNSPSLAVVYASMCGMGCLAALSLSEPDCRGWPAPSWPAGWQTDRLLGRCGIW